MPHNFTLERDYRVERIFFKKVFLPTETGPAGEKNQVSYLLITTDFTQFSADAFHLVGKGALLAAQGLSDTAVGNLVVFTPQLNDAVGIRVELLKALEQLRQKGTVCIDIFHADGFGKLGVKERAIVVGIRCIERKRTVAQVVFTVFAVAIAGPEELLRAFAAVMILFLFADGSGHAVEVLKLLLRAGDFLLGGADIDKASVLIVIDCHVIVSFRLLNRSGDNLYGCQCCLS